MESPNSKDPSQGSFIVFQVTNLDRKETFFGFTDTQLEQEVTRIAQDPNGLARGWLQGDLVIWRPLTPLVTKERAVTLAADLQSKNPSPEYRVLRAD